MGVCIGRNTMSGPAHRIPGRGDFDMRESGILMHITSLPGVNPAILDPRDTYADVAEWQRKAEDLAGRFVKNFVKYTGNEAGKALVEAGPKL